MFHQNLVMTVLISGLLSIGCKAESSFSGGATRGKIPSEDVKKTPEPPKTQETVPPVNPGPVIPDPDKQEPLVVTPENAVTKGSFTVWADPPNPRPNQKYMIFMRVTLPNNTNGYSKSDLSGRLTGSDGYYQIINGGEKTYNGTSNFPRYPQTFEFTPTNNTATLSMTIIGAQRNVRDTITIKSGFLNESQSIAVVFQ
ncbi:MAG: hypothetical protein NTV34_12970 [Proteobacteria bacterium]|nr:hypothetical protein [Pseudomonadota bacterium]